MDRYNYDYVKVFLKSYGLKEDAANDKEFAFSVMDQLMPHIPEYLQQNKPNVNKFLTYLYEGVDKSTLLQDYYKQKSKEETSQLQPVPIPGRYGTAGHIGNVPKPESKLTHSADILSKYYDVKTGKFKSMGLIGSLVEGAMSGETLVDAITTTRNEALKEFNDHVMSDPKLQRIFPVGITSKDIDEPTALDETMQKVGGLLGFGVDYLLLNALLPGSSILAKMPGKSRIADGAMKVISKGKLWPKVIQRIDWATSIGTKFELTDVIHDVMAKKPYHFGHSFAVGFSLALLPPLRLGGVFGNMAAKYLLNPAMVTTLFTGYNALSGRPIKPRDVLTDYLSFAMNDAFIGLGSKITGGPKRFEDIIRGSIESNYKAMGLKGDDLKESINETYKQTMKMYRDGQQHYYWSNILGINRMSQTLAEAPEKAETARFLWITPTMPDKPVSSVQVDLKKATSIYSDQTDYRMNGRLNSLFDDMGIDENRKPELFKAVSDMALNSETGMDFLNGIRDKLEVKDMDPKLLANWVNVYQTYKYMQAYNTLGNVGFKAYDLENNELVDAKQADMNAPEYALPMNIPKRIADSFVRLSLYKNIKGEYVPWNHYTDKERSLTLYNLYRKGYVFFGNRETDKYQFLVKMHPEYAVSEKPEYTVQEPTQKQPVTEPVSNPNISLKGGYSPEGRGTPQGDGKDKAMRQAADGAIVELALDKPSSSKTTLDKLGNPKNNSKTVMLARNGELKGKPISQHTKDTILKAYNNGAEFVVGDMPGVDTPFIDYLNEIGAKYTIYHAGSKPRIPVQRTRKLVEKTSVEKGTMTPVKKETPVHYGKKLNPVLSNFYEKLFTFKGKTFKTAEGAYQAFKSGKYVDGFNDLTGIQAKRKGASIRVNTKSNIQLMHDILKAKYEQVPEFKEALDKSGVITHPVQDKFWKDKFPELLNELKQSVQPVTITTQSAYEAFMERNKQAIEDTYKQFTEDIKKNVNGITDDDIRKWIEYDMRNMYLYARDVFGEKNIESLGDILKFTKRMQIPTSNGFVADPSFFGEINDLSNEHPVPSLTVQKIPDASEVQRTDGKSYMRNDVFNALCLSTGLNPNEVDIIKPMIHTGELGIKTAIWRAIPSMDRQMHSDNVHIYSHESAMKYDNGLQMNGKSIIPIPTIRVKFGERLDVTSDYKLKKHNLYRQMLYGINDENINKHIDEAANELMNKLKEAQQDPQKMQEFLKEIFKKPKESLEDYEDLIYNISEATSQGNAIVKALLYNPLVQQLRISKDYVRKSVYDHIRDNVLSPKYYGHVTVVAGLPDYIKNDYPIDDHSTVLGSEFGKLNAQQLKELTGIELPKGAKTLREYFDNGGKPFRAAFVRAPMEARSGVRVLNIIGVDKIENHSGTSVFLTRTNMDYLGGADNDIDKTMMYVGLPDSYLDMIKQWHDYKRGFFATIDNVLAKESTGNKYAGSLGSIFNPLARADIGARNIDSKEAMGRIMSLYRTLTVMKQHGNKYIPDNYDEIMIKWLRKSVDGAKYGGMDDWDITREHILNEILRASGSKLSPKRFMKGLEYKTTSSLFGKIYGRDWENNRHWDISEITEKIVGYFSSIKSATTVEHGIELLNRVFNEYDNSILRHVSKEGYSRFLQTRPEGLRGKGALWYAVYLQQHGLYTLNDIEALDKLPNNVIEGLNKLFQDIRGKHGLKSDDRLLINDLKNNPNKLDIYKSWLRSINVKANEMLMNDIYDAASEDMVTAWRNSYIRRGIPKSLLAKIETQVKMIKILWTSGDYEKAHTEVRKLFGETPLPRYAKMYLMSSIFHEGVSHEKDRVFKIGWIMDYLDPEITTELGSRMLKKWGIVTDTKGSDLYPFVNSIYESLQSLPDNDVKTEVKYNLTKLLNGEKPIRYWDVIKAHNSVQEQQDKQFEKQKQDIHKQVTDVFMGRVFKTNKSVPDSKLMTLKKRLIEDINGSFTTPVDAISFISLVTKRKGEYLNLDKHPLTEPEVDELNRELTWWHRAHNKALRYSLVNKLILKHLFPEDIAKAHPVTRKYFEAIVKLVRGSESAQKRYTTVVNDINNTLKSLFPGTEYEEGSRQFMKYVTSTDAGRERFKKEHAELANTFDYLMNKEQGLKWLIDRFWTVSLDGYKTQLENLGLDRDEINKRVNAIKRSDRYWPRFYDVNDPHTQDIIKSMLERKRYADPNEKAALGAAPPHWLSNRGIELYDFKRGWNTIIDHMINYTERQRTQKLMDNFLTELSTLEGKFKDIDYKGWNTFLNYWRTWAEDVMGKSSKVHDVQLIKYKGNFILTYKDNRGIQKTEEVPTATLDTYKANAQTLWNTFKRTKNMTPELEYLLAGNDPQQLQNIVTMPEDRIIDHIANSLQIRDANDYATVFKVKNNVWERARNNMTSFMVNMSFAKFLGWRIRSSVRNMMQAYWPIYIYGGFKAITDRSRWLNESSDNRKLAEEMFDRAGLGYGLVTSELTLADKDISDMQQNVEAEQAYDNLIKMGKHTAGLKTYWGYKFAKWTEWLSGKGGTLAAAGAMMRSPKNLGEKQPFVLSFQGIEHRNRKLAFLSGFIPVYKDAKHRYIELGYTESEAGKKAQELGLEAGRKLVTLTQFDYHTYAKPEILRTNAGNIFLMFKTYTYNYYKLHEKILNDAWQAATGRAGSKEEIMRALRLIFIHTITLPIAIKGFDLGYYWSDDTIKYFFDLYRWLTGQYKKESELFYGGSPLTILGPVVGNMLDLLLFSVANDDDKLMRAVKKNPLNPIPNAAYEWWHTLDTTWNSKDNTWIWYRWGQQFGAPPKSNQNQALSGWLW